jgi:hypothetical protein
MAVGTEQARDPDKPGIMAQSIFNFRQSSLRSIGHEEAQLANEQNIDRGRQVSGHSPVDEPEQHEGTQRTYAGDRKRPAKRRGSSKSRQAHEE